MLAARRGDDKKLIVRRTRLLKCRAFGAETVLGRKDQ
jgi:hypothetical protein